MRAPIYYSTQLSSCFRGAIRAAKQKCWRENITGFFEIRNIANLLTFLFRITSSFTMKELGGWRSGSITTSGSRAIPTHTGTLIGVKSLLAKQMSEDARWKGFLALSFGRKQLFFSKG